MASGLRQGEWETAGQGRSRPPCQPPGSSPDFEQCCQPSCPGSSWGVGPRHRRCQDQGTGPWTGRDWKASRLRTAGPARDLSQASGPGRSRSRSVLWVEGKSPHHSGTCEFLGEPATSQSWEGNFTALQSWLREPHWTRSSRIEWLQDVCQVLAGLRGRASWRR